MIRTLQSLMVIVSILLSLTIYPQSTPVAHFSSGDKTFADNFSVLLESRQSESIAPEHAGHYFRLLQFYDLPEQKAQEELERLGIKLIAYIPDNTYLVGIPQQLPYEQLSQFGVRSIAPIDAEDKLDQRLLHGEWPDWAVVGRKIKVMVQTYGHKDWAGLLRKLIAAGYEPVDQMNSHPYVFLEVYPEEMLGLASLKFVQYVDIGPDPGEPDDTGGRTLQRANMIDNQLPNGLRYDGAGLGVLVRDDGAVGPHIDFEGRLYDFSGGSDVGIHGDGVAGVLAGAGNLESASAGAASGADVYVISYQSEFTDITIELHEQNGVKITNSSYGNGCNAGYTTTTQMVDEQMREHPSLMHVFSAGNSNGSDCGYGAGNLWGNITGGHKQGKNVIAVANLFADGSLVSSSSRGPASDGRIKPDIAAHGQGERSTKPNNDYQTFGGSSAAAPTMAGSYAQLYQAYREHHNGDDPNAGLLKAIVLNTAQDLGNEGPDFRYGWGRIDAYRAYMTIHEGTFSSGTISQGQIQMHSIEIPEDVIMAKAMVYWTDPPASPSANQALVNDLDATFREPSGMIHFPYILNHAPDANTLNAPATKGPDHLNNMEQVVIEDPQAGTYEVVVRGHTVPMGPQEYYVVWTFFYDEIVMTYPRGGENFIPDQVERVHWDAHGESGTFSLEYSINGGSSWILVATDIPADERMYNWTVPSVISGNVRVRVRRGSQIGASAGPINIIGQPTNLSFSDVCKTGATLTWDGAIGADSYEIYRLGEKYMESVLVTTERTYTFLDISEGETEWFAVAALNMDGTVGRRTDAIPYFGDPTFSNCINTIEFTKSLAEDTYRAGDTMTYILRLESFYEDQITNLEIRDTLAPGIAFVPGSASCGSFENGVFTLDQPSLASGGVLQCSFDVEVSLDSATVITLSDDLEGDNNDWRITNVDGSATWSIATDNPHSPTNAWFSPNVGSGNQLQYLRMPKFHVIAGAQLAFYHSYNTEPGWDGGYLEVSTDNGNQWHEISASDYLSHPYNGFLGFGSNDEIAGKFAFTGNSGGYVQSIIDLSSFVGLTIDIRFVFGEDDNTSEQGWYIDDFEVMDPYSISNIAAVSYTQGPITYSNFLNTRIFKCEEQCYRCEDGIQNYGETDVDCGGPCIPCPCTDTIRQVVFGDTLIVQDQVDKYKLSISTDGEVSVGAGSYLRWQAGRSIILDSIFTVLPTATFEVLIEDCIEIDN